jgi:hypothetical protein
MCSLAFQLGIAADHTFVQHNILICQCAITHEHGVTHGYIRCVIDRSLKTPQTLSTMSGARVSVWRRCRYSMCGILYLMPHTAHTAGKPLIPI